MTVGLCSIISVPTMQVFTYCFKTYELALAQAIENQKGVTYRIQRFPELCGQNGLRQTHFRIQEIAELIAVLEVEVGEAVLPVLDAARAIIAGEHP
jgi:hypothetical protein